MSDAEYKLLREAGLRREISPGEMAQIRAILAANPKESRELMEELALNRALRGLPAVRMASNFTSRVMDAVARVQATPAPATRSWWARWFGWRLIPKLAALAVFGFIGWFGYYQHQVQARLKLAQSVAQVCDLTTQVPLEWLQNYEAIHRLAQVPEKSDDDLFFALSK
jgi:anti-sigma factor RsiW